MAALSLQKIDKRFGDHQVLRQVDLEVEPGAIHFILGRSGAGKSQLIKGVVGLSPFDAGEVICFGERLDGTAASVHALNVLNIVVGV